MARRQGRLITTALTTGHLAHLSNFHTTRQTVDNQIVPGANSAGKDFTSLSLSFPRRVAPNNKPILGTNSSALNRLSVGSSRYLSW